MKRLSQYRRVLLALIVTAPLAGGIAQAGQEDMDISVSFYTTWEGRRGRLYVSLRWTDPGGNLGGFRLYDNGEYIGGIGGHGTTDSCRVFSDSFSSYDRFMRDVHDYLSRPHTYVMKTRRYPAGTSVWDEFEYLPPHILRIQNGVEGFSEFESRAVEIRHAQDAAEDRDETDLDYSPGLLTRNANIVSTLWEPEAESQTLLEVDARPLDSTTDVHLQVSLSSASGDPVAVASSLANTLSFSFPYSRNTFGVCPITIQQYDPADPSRQYPIYDVRKVIHVNDGVMPLADLQGSYESGVPYAHFRLSFTREPSRDLYEDQCFDLRDFAVLAQAWRTAGMPSVADTAGPFSTGLPDRRVDGLDLQAVSYTHLTLPTN